MNYSIKKSIAAGVLVSSISLSVFADINETVENSFTVASNSTFSLSNINGSVDIVSWNENNIKVIATIEADNQEDRDRIKVKMNQSGQKVTVITEYEKNSSFNRNNSGEVSYKVWMPANTNLEDIELVNGSLTIADIHGEVEAELVNGSIKATGLKSDSEFSSVNGSIKAYYQSFDGDINDVEIETVNGSIKLYLPENVNAKLDIDTLHGSIKTDFGLQAEKKSFVGKSLTGNIGQGGAKINLESVNGSIKVLSN